MTVEVLELTAVQAERLMMTTEGRATITFAGRQSDWDPAIYYRPYELSSVVKGERVHVLMRFGEDGKWTRSLGWWKIEVGPVLDNGSVWFDVGHSMVAPRGATTHDFVALFTKLEAEVTA